MENYTSENIASGSGTSNRPGSNDNNTEFVQCIKDFPLGFGSNVLETRNVGEKGRVDLVVMNELTNQGKIIKGCSSIVGSVPGIVVGDRFRYRVELVIVGLHKHFERGIDTIDWGCKKIATCVVASEGHSDNMNDPNVLIYIGEGGNARAKEVEKPSYQKLKGGNLALWESKMLNSPVRVVKGFRVDRLCRGRVVQRTEYVYDGLYEVQSCEKKQGLLLTRELVL